MVKNRSVYQYFVGCGSRGSLGGSLLDSEVLLECFWGAFGVLCGRFGGASIKDAKIASQEVPKSSQVEGFGDHFGTILEAFFD